jgi:hypothetical protein
MKKTALANENILKHQYSMINAGVSPVRTADNPAKSALRKYTTLNVQRAKREPLINHKNTPAKPINRAMLFSAGAPNSQVRISIKSVITNMNPSSLIDVFLKKSSYTFHSWKLLTSAAGPTWQKMVRIASCLRAKFTVCHDGAEVAPFTRGASLSARHKAATHAARSTLVSLSLVRRS